jgi:lysophospholipase L1-like esterase
MTLLRSLLLLPILYGTLASVSVAGAPPVVVMLGDSTTAVRPGAIDRVYASRVEQTLVESGFPVRVINAGLGGNSTTDGLDRFDKDVLTHHPDLVVIQFGINDSAVDVWRNPPATSPRVSIETFGANLRRLIERSRQAGARVVLMTTNPIRWTPKLKELYGKLPYNPDRPDGFDLPLLSRYNAAARRVANEAGVPLVDVHAEFMRGDVDGLLLDGMHPGDAGHAIVAGLLAPVIRKQLQIAR